MLIKKQHELDQPHAAGLSGDCPATRAMHQWQEPGGHEDDQKTASIKLVWLGRIGATSFDADLARALLRTSNIIAFAEPYSASTTV